jgi:sugar (pentulose or hexulose) kinase
MVIFDVGKSNAKLTLCSADGTPTERRTRSNALIKGERYLELDVEGLEQWLRLTLREFAKLAEIECLLPVCHGAAAVLVAQERLFAPAMDYEDDPDAADRLEYLLQRDDFRDTGSPSLPHGLNLGMQLHRLERMTGPWPSAMRILLWPQYWAWRLCGVMASEITSLGCHSDLWRPLERRFTRLSDRRGWSERLPPLRNAWDTLGNLGAEWVSDTGLSKTCRVLCGLHDSNAALLAARTHPEVAGRDVSVVSTGTWFVAMRVSADPGDVDMSQLQERLDCLLNVDVQKSPVPSARFMGGREAELITETNLDANAWTQAQVRALLAGGAMALPSFVPGVGPFPDAKALWRRRPEAAADRLILASLYLALMTDACLSLIGSRETIIVEGRFADWSLFVRALARLRRQPVFTSPDGDGITAGALRLARNDLTVRDPLRAVEPLDIDLESFAARWRAHAAG